MARLDVGQSVQQAFLDEGIVLFQFGEKQFIFFAVYPLCRTPGSGTDYRAHWWEKAIISFSSGRI
jgi:hypothetical protein